MNTVPALIEDRAHEVPEAPGQGQCGSCFLQAIGKINGLARFMPVSLLRQPI